MSPSLLLFAIAAVIALLGLILHLAARRSNCPLARQVDRVAGHLLWALAIAAIVLGLVGPSPSFDRVSGNIPGGVVLLMISTVILAIAVLLIRTIALRQRRRAAGNAPAPADRIMA